MKKGKVTGIGGVFFKTDNPEETKEWYKKNLGLNTDQWGCTFWWNQENGKKGSTQWSPFDKNTDYFNPSEKEFMINYRVENLVELLAELKQNGVTVMDKVEEYDYGKFGWVIDLDGNKIELWEPKDEAFL
ncbi:VOC family protein [Tenacibaculum xiamenense]|uniref:VOC family protein n=1 Tax=Tenacibaculum xiamenense TaxID=1261553 RepID=UPI003894E3EB